ncbi:hypothetical protein P3S68_031107 [Capsicum galapagoense]
MMLLLIMFHQLRLMKLANDESDMVNNAKVMVKSSSQRARNRTNKNQQKLYLVMVELLTTGNLYYVIDGPPKTNSLSQEAKVHVQSTLISRGVMQFL